MIDRGDGVELVESPCVLDPVVVRATIMTAAMPQQNPDNA